MEIFLNNERSNNIMETFSNNEMSNIMEMPSNVLGPSEPLPENVAAILPPNYNYVISKIQQLPNYITGEGFSIQQFEVKLFVNISNIENIRQWFSEFEDISKTTMPESKGFQVK